jgi:hypothetical protein
MNTSYIKVRYKTAPFLSWYQEGARAALFLRPRWERVHASPMAVALLTALAVLLTITLERLYIQGDAQFSWRAIGSGWLGAVMTAWVCYLVRPSGAYDTNPNVAPGAAALFCMVLAVAQVIMLAGGAVYLGLQQAGLVNRQALGASGLWALWLVPILWAVLAELTVVLRGAARRLLPRLLAVPVLVLSTLQVFWLPPTQFWRVATPEQEARAELALTQELMEAQPQLLALRLGEIAPQRPGMVDLYAITFAPFSDEDVFRRESDMVTAVMAQRFDAQGRGIQLVNHVETVEQWPWATRNNLRRAIRHIASVMDRDEDILFLHLTSHGARDGQLAADFWPMMVHSITPADLKSWLDEAGVRYRVLSISACYAGSWIAPLADDGTLIMTAADAFNTSYGCGRGSELTFFGRALFDEQLREHTLSFEQAHAAARVVIERREEEAGKEDGYSNPQIEVGDGIRERLDLFQRQRAR